MNHSILQKYVEQLKANISAVELGENLAKAVEPANESIPSNSECENLLGSILIFWAGSFANNGLSLKNLPDWATDITLSKELEALVYLVLRKIQKNEAFSSDNSLILIELNNYFKSL